MRWGVGIAWLSLAVSSAAVAAAGPALSRGPYLQLLTGHSVTVVWRTSAPAACGLELHRSDGPSRTLTGQTGSTCAIPVDGLTPGGRYGYVPTADGTPLRNESVFHTDDPKAAFRFVVVGDSGTGDANQAAVRDRMVAANPDFIVHTGDMVYEDGLAADFDPRVFAPYADLMRHVVLWPCLGNHDMRTNAGQPWRDAFYTPANNPAHTKSYYSFEYGNAHVVVLNSSEPTTPDSEQYAFLDRDLGASTATWNLVAFHHTIYSSGSKHGSNLMLRTNLLPAIDAHRVDLVFMGHEHNYERTVSLRNGRPAAPGEGTVYVTTGGGGDTIYPVGHSDFTAHAEAVQHLVQVAVQGGTLTAQMIRRDGSTGDSFTLRKSTSPTASP